MEKLVLTKGQQTAFDKFQAFLNDKSARVFILKGYAGTGKTTLVRKLIDELNSREQKYTLLASTGRAAKILANATDCAAKTVHGEIYRFKSLNQNLESIAKQREELKTDNSGQLLLNFELVEADSEVDGKPKYYIVDEASMVPDVAENNPAQAMFGSGRLLADLFQYDDCGKFIFVGDVCQLPPITQPISPALSAEYIQSEFGFSCYEAELTEVVRQSADVDIVQSAHRVRQLYSHPQYGKWAKFPFRGYRDIHILNSQMSLIDQYIHQIQAGGFNSATMLCFTNKQCDMSTRLIRPHFGHLSQELEKGDLLLVTQNNLCTGLMNGDLVTVEDIAASERRAGMTFLKVSVKELFTKRVYSLLLIAEVLYGNQTNVSSVQQKELFMDYYYRMKSKGISHKSKEFERHMWDDPYLNALRAVFGYALTCHKSQGGEWDYVYLDIPRNVPGLEKPYVYQWIYTAMTRAKKGLYVVDDFWVE